MGKLFHAKRSPAPVKNADVAVPTPVKMDPEAIKGSHAAEAAAADGSKDEAKIDLGTLFTATDSMARENAAQELVNLLKVCSDCLISPQATELNFAID